jgi:hypothetical protein
MKRFQFIWWGFGPRHWRLRMAGPYPSCGKAYGSIYRWRLLIGPFEIRRWTAGQVDLLEHCREGNRA